MKISTKLILTGVLSAGAGFTASYFLFRAKNKKEIDDLYETANAMIEDNYEAAKNYYEGEIEDLKKVIDNLQAENEGLFASIEENRDLKMGEVASDLEALKEHIITDKVTPSEDKIKATVEAALAQKAFNKYSGGNPTNFNVETEKEMIDIPDQPKEHVNIFDKYRDVEPDEPIDEERQKRFEEGKNHILDEHEDWWDTHGDRDQYIPQKPKPKSGLVDYDFFINDRASQIRCASYYRNDDILIDDDKCEPMNDEFDMTVGWDWLDEYDPSSEGFAYVYDAENKIIYQLSVEDDYWFAHYDSDTDTWVPGAKDRA